LARIVLPGTNKQEARGHVFHLRFTLAYSLLLLVMRLTTATRKLRAPSSLRENQSTFSSERGRKSPGGFISEKEREAQRYAGEEDKKIKREIPPRSRLDRTLKQTGSNQIGSLIPDGNTNKNQNWRVKRWKTKSALLTQ
jgi:hypothetical protein